MSKDIKDTLVTVATIVLVLLSCYFMTGCSTLSKIANAAANANDEALKTSEFAICRGASVGAVLRRYNTKELADAWVKLCIRENDSAPIIVTGVVDER